MNKKKGHRSSLKKGYYKNQYVRTAKNKIRRLNRRTSFDPTAQAAIAKLSTVTPKDRA